MGVWGLPVIGGAGTAQENPEVWGELRGTPRGGAGSAMGGARPGQSGAGRVCGALA